MFRSFLFFAAVVVLVLAQGCVTAGPVAYVYPGHTTTVGQPSQIVVYQDPRDVVVLREQDRRDFETKSRFILEQQRLQADRQRDRQYIEQRQQQDQIRQQENLRRDAIRASQQFGRQAQSVRQDFGDRLERYVRSQNRR